LINVVLLLHYLLGMPVKGIVSYLITFQK